MTAKSLNPQVCRFNDYWLGGHGSIPLCLDGPWGHIQPLIKWVKENFLWEPKADYETKISAIGQNNTSGKAS